MNLGIQKALSSLFVAFAIFLMLPPLGLAATAINGAPLDTNATSSDGFCWDATTFGGFYYSANKHKDLVASENWFGERLQYIETDDQYELGKNNPGNHVIGEEELVYSTRQFPNKYKVVSELGLDGSTTPSELGGMVFYKIPWFGKPYVAVENDATQLANLVIDQEGSDKKILKAGDVWDLGKGYSLTVNQVDVEGNKVWFSLSKDGEELESGIVNADGTVESQTFTAKADFGDGKDQLYFITYVDSVFVSATDSFAVFKYTWLIDKDDILIIKEGDEYQGFEVKEASEDELVLKNTGSITLNLDKDVKNYFTDSWYFMISDEGKGSTSPNGYVICPVKELSKPGNYTLRGVPFDTGLTSSDEFCWDPTTFGGLYYSINKHKDLVASENWFGERLQYIETDGQCELGKNNPGNNVIGEEELVYSTKQFPNKYKVVSELGLDGSTTPSELGGMVFYKIPWFGKPYVAVENDATQLANLVIDQDGSDKKILKAGDVWELGKGYSLTVNQVDVEGNKVWFSLSKEGEELESGIVNADGTVESQTFTAKADFGDGKDQLYFITYVDSVFVSSFYSFAVFKYTWLIDKDNILIIENGDEYQGFEVKEASENGIVLKNSDSITLNLDKDKNNYFTDSWYFQTSDEGKGSTSPSGYVIYPATDVVIEAEKASESADNSTEEANVADAAPGSNESKNVSPDYRAAPSSSSKIAGSEDSESYPEGATEESSVKLPGFGIISGISGVMICLLLRRKR
ncbi:MAG: S-layer protein domain-containing protein [Methanosarcina sp.]|uniref:S-layer protein domain-containing protein n=1 Tax=Methanosarcina sp. TaxID=2213 RepID=UPI002602208E|nr:S-layer protein domain-containing protein [Methanosarcina sp.]MDD3246210.1 S-layer protein domain-containing protein [Methanosarcina sp.]MDD4247692.1 S-layer protein domain-containing protein [Methanosarcina sp.]